MSDQSDSDDTREVNFDRSKVSRALRRKRNLVKRKRLAVDESEAAMGNHDVGNTVFDSEDVEIEIEKPECDFVTSEALTNPIPKFDNAAELPDDAMGIEKRAKTDAISEASRVLELYNESVEDGNEDVNSASGLSKEGTSRRRKAERPTILDLKMSTHRPELVESMDNCAPDPLWLLFIKSLPNTVPVPRHWSSKRKFLAGKKMSDHAKYKLPDYIEQTGIARVRKSIIDRENQQSLKASLRDRARPKSHTLDLDYEVLYNAFFKHQTKPANLTGPGEVYYEGREFGSCASSIRVGILSRDLREALGMPDGAPPPWLLNMQKHGPPPAYPSLKVPGVNCPIPMGAKWGYNPGGWGTAPVDARGLPLYGGAWNPDVDRCIESGGIIIDPRVPKATKSTFWGEWAEDLGPHHAPQAAVTR